MQRKTSSVKMSKKTSFFELWRTRKERGELLERVNELRLRPSQLRQLLGDSGVRAALQDTRMASLLPPVGTETFRRLTPASLEEIEQLHEADKKDTRKLCGCQATENDPVKPACDLEEGKPLPFFYGVPPPELLSTPLEELDPFYQSQKTFIVLGKGNIIHRLNAESVCYLLSPFSPLRTFAIKSLIHSFFSLFIMVTVLTNCVLMTISDPPTWIQTVEHVFTAIYTFEVVVKVVSRGLCVGKFTFLRDPWNWLDVVVVSTGYLTVFVDLGKGSVLKTVPRVLKLITVIPGLKRTVGALVQSLKGLAEVIILTVVCLSFFALIGLRFFSGSLRGKCVMWPPNGSTEFDYNEYITNEANYYYFPGHLDALVCGNMSHAGTCPEGYLCLRAGRSPNYGYTSYDSFGWSLLSFVRLMSKDFWENLMQLTLRANGKAFFTIFAVVLFPGCFCLLSLLVAVVAMVSGEREEADVAELKRREEEFGQILEALKTREEESKLSQLDGEHQKSLEGLDQHQRSCPPCWLVFTNFLQKWKCCGRLQWLVTDPFFDLGVVVCLILNIVFMSMEHFPMTARFEEMLSAAGLVFTLIFTAEMVLKIMTMGLYGYFQVGWNIFDSILVIISLLKLFVLANLRWLLVMRVFRLARWWPALHMLIKVMWTSVRALRNLTLVLLMMVFLFSVAGMQLFQQDYKDYVCRISMDCTLPRWHMNDFYHAFLTIIKVLCGNWIESMWDCMEVSGQTTCLIFFMTVLIIGKFLVLSLFLGLLLSSFSSLAASDLKGRTNLQIAMSRIGRAVRALLGKKTHINPYHKEVDSKEVDRKEHLTLTLVTSTQPASEKLPEVQQHEGDEDDQKGDKPEDCCCNKCYRCCPFLDIDTSRGTGRVWSIFRKICSSIVQHKCFEIFIIIIIVLSCAALVFEDVHLQHRQVLKMLVERADQVFTTVFLVEMVLKWFAFGLKKYFEDVWCWLDFLILQVSLVSLAVNMFGFSQLRVVHSLRALLPLRMLSHVQSLKVVLLLVLRTLWSTFDVVLVFLTVWLVFSVVGVNMFAGKFYYCFNETSMEFFYHETVSNKSDCFSLIMANFTEVQWKSPDLTYDSVLSGYLALLHMATFESYDIMYAAVDSLWVQSQPIYGYNEYMYLYFFSFIIISSFFTFNVFIRAIFDNLQGDKSAGRPVFMTQEQQKQCQAMKKRMMEPRKVFPRPQNRCQAWLFDLVTKPSFDLFIVVLICLYLVTLMTETYDESEEKCHVLYWIRFTFIILFLVEFILKVIALRRHYFTGWNIFDFIVIMASISGFFLSDIMERYFTSPQLFILVSPHLFLALRVVHLFRVPLWVKGFRKLLLALMMSLPALFNIGLLLFIIMFTYSIFGMFNFAYVKKTASINDLFNFETFGSSLICMFMVTPSGGWGDLLHPMMETPPDCDPGVENLGSEVRGNCGSPAVSIIFFVSHIILFFLLAVHLYLAVILETLSAEDADPLSDNDLQMFYKTWRKFDPESSQFIQSSELSDFCDALQDPLKIPIKLIHKDRPLLPEDRIHFTDVLLAVATQVYGDSGNSKSLKARVEELFTTNLSKASRGPISSTLTAGQVDEAATVAVDSGGVSAS